LDKWEVYSLNSKGQFSIIAALLVAVILIATVITTYSTIRNTPIQDQPQVLSAVDETNLAIKQILGFTVGYYGSVLQVTGNSTCAKMLAMEYLQSGFYNIAVMHPEWGTSISLNKTDLHTYWFTNASYSTGDLAVTYNLTDLGMYGITYETSSRLDVQVLNTTANNQACLNITEDEETPLINLGKQNFEFYSYAYSNSTWTLINPSDQPTVFANGTYLINVPPGIVDPYSYIIQVQDPRGIIVVASSFSHYTCTLNWNSTLYSALKNATDATLAIELLQNGTMRWLGQNLQLTTNTTKPIPSIPVKDIHVNQTISGINQEVPFQIEDWASNYRIPLGLTNNASIFNSGTMLVSLVNSNVSKVTIWWNGSDTAQQTPYAYTNKYFTGDNTSTGILTNGMVTLQFGSGFTVTSTNGNSICTANFMRINTQWSVYGSGQAYVIHHGIVRDIVQTEAEWSNGVTGCPNVYSQIVLTLPANATYYTYQSRLIFINSTQTRSITDICPIQVNAAGTGVFGSTTSGSSYTSINANNMYGSLFTSPSVTAIAESMSFYGRSGSGYGYGYGANVKCLIVRQSDMNIIAVTNPVAVGGSTQWWTATFSSPPTLSPNTQYVLMIIPDNSVRFYYTTGSTNQGYYDTSNSYSSPINPTDASNNNYQYNVYCNYAVLQTENGTSSGYPIVSNGSGLFYNSSVTCWQHHWSQIASTSTRGVGIMFSDVANQMLYVFDNITGKKTGALNVDAATEIIQLLPVATALNAPANFTYALDVIWYGAVVTFDGTTPIYKSDGSGLWIMAEYPPTITVTTES
jgi:hypothetical protein